MTLGLNAFSFICEIKVSSYCILYLNSLICLKIENNYNFLNMKALECVFSLLSGTSGDEKVVVGNYDSDKKSTKLLLK